MFKKSSRRAPYALLPLALACAGTLAGTCVSGDAAAACMTIRRVPGTILTPFVQTHAYTVRLHELNVSRTRAKFTDTLTISMAAKVNGEMRAPVTFPAMNFGSGVQTLDHVAYTFDAPDDADVEVLVSIMNNHDPNDAASKAVSVLNSISDYAEGFVQTAYPLGPVWPAVNSAVHTVNGWFSGSCDGEVAADAILGKGETFRDWTANGIYYGEFHRHDGSPTPWYAFCGATSLYFTQYSLERS